MRIDRLLLTAFGRFQGQAFDLGPGLTILYGHNEAGKTTVQKFILGMLYGFKKRSSRRDYTEDAARYRPWQGDEYRGALVYTLDRTGRSYRVERQFDPRRETVRVFDADTGADISGQFPMDRRKELLFAERHLGVPEEVFRSTAWVGQMEVGKLEMGRELVARVANMQESGREDLSVRNALRMLEERAREIGSERAPTRPYARVARLMEEKRAELDRAMEARRQTQAWEAALTEVRAVLSELETELSDLHRRHDAALLRETEARLERVRSALSGAGDAQGRAADLRRYADFPVHLRDRLLRTQGDLGAAERDAGRYQARLAELTAAAAAVKAQLDQYPGMAAHGHGVLRSLESADQAAKAAELHLPGLREEAARLAEAVARVDEALEPLRAAAEQGAAVTSRLESLERELASLRQRSDQQVLDSARLEVSRLEKQARAAGGAVWLALGGAAGLGAAFAGLPSSVGLSLVALTGLPELWAWGGAGVLGALALAALGFYLSGRRRARRITGSLQAARTNLLSLQQNHGQNQERAVALERQREKALASVGAASAADVRNRVVRYEQLSARRDGQQVRLDAVQGEIARLEAAQSERRAGLHRQLAAALNLAPAELAQTGDPVAVFETGYAAFQELRHRWETSQRETADVASRLAEAREQAARLRAEQEAMLAEAGVAEVEEFMAGCANREAWAKAESEAGMLDHALRSLTGGEAPAALEARAAELRQRLRGFAPADPGDREALQVEIRRLEARRAELSLRSSDLAARVETALQDAPDVADLRRELEALAEERLGLDAELAAIDLARSTIVDVSAEIHREFAPRLNGAMGEIVASLTGGRYRHVRIDDEMAIRAITAGDRTVDLLSLSAGTVDQFYFALRVALLDLISQEPERIPLILDDPFVQYDEHRLLASMEYLAALSADRQVLLLTCHQREVRIAQSLGRDVTLIDLTEGAADSDGPDGGAEPDVAAAAETGRSKKEPPE